MRDALASNDLGTVATIKKANPRELATQVGFEELGIDSLNRTAPNVTQMSCGHSRSVEK